MGLFFALGFNFSILFPFEKETPLSSSEAKNQSQINSLTIVLGYKCIYLFK
jgi:hypothetical protein